MHHELGCDQLLTPTPGYDDLLDDDIRNAASFKKDEILLPGRNVRLSPTVRF